MKKSLSVLLISSLSLWLFAQPGALDLTFDPGIGANKTVNAFAVQADGKILVGGHFNKFNGALYKKLVRLNLDGSIDTTFRSTPGGNKGIYTIAVQPDQKILAGGRLTDYNGDNVGRMIRVHPDGTLDTTFNTGSGFDGYVRKVALQQDGKILVGGYFTSYNGNSAPYFIRLNQDGSRDTTFNIGAGPNNSVEDIAIQPDGKIIIVGDFTGFNGNTLGRITRLNPDGSRDPDFINISTILGAFGVIYNVFVQEGGKILIGGSFQSYSGITRNRIAQLHDDGMLDSHFNPNPGANKDVIKAALLFLNNDGNPDECIIGGDISTYDNQPVNKLAVLRTDGSLNSDFSTITGPDSAIFSITQHPDGRVLIGGDFIFYDGISRNRVARIYVCETGQPGPIAGSDSVLCPGETFVYAAPIDPVVDRYEWTLPQGWTGSSDSASITVTTNGEGGEISVIAYTDSCGYSDPQTKIVYRKMPPEVPICLVTVDTASTHNILIWQKPADKSLIDSFFIYREITTNTYNKIAAIHVDSLSEYHDYDADPNSTSYRYKLSVLDVCGIEVDTSLFHKTIHFQNLGDGDFQWNKYEIENSPNPVLSFNIYRDDASTGNFLPIGVVSGGNTTFTDVNFSAFPNSQYVVDANWNISCSPSRIVNTTRSNIRKKGQIDIIISSIAETDDRNIEVYPNPTDDIVYISLPSGVFISRLQLFNSLGKQFWKKESTEATYQEIDVSILPRGVYVLAIETNSRSIRKKVIIQ